MYLTAGTLKVLKDALNEKIGGFVRELGINTSGRIDNIIGKLSDSPILKTKIEDEVGEYPFYSGMGTAPAHPIPISAFYFSLFAVWFVFLCRRVWTERRKTRVYYGDGTSELSYALGGRQLIQGSAGNSSLPIEEDTGESKEHAWRIENLKKVLQFPPSLTYAKKDLTDSPYSAKLVKCVEARDSLLANAIVSMTSLLLLELLSTSLNLLHLIGATHLLSSIILCERKH